MKKFVILCLCLLCAGFAMRTAPVFPPVYAEQTQTAVCAMAPSAQTFAFCNQFAPDSLAAQAYRQLEENISTLRPGSSWFTEFTFAQPLTAYSDDMILSTARRQELANAVTPDIFAAVDAFRYDHPQYWMLDNTCSVYSVTSAPQKCEDGRYLFTLMLSVRISTLSGNDEQFQQTLDGLTFSGSTRYQTLRNIHSYLCRRCTYDVDGTVPTAHSAYGALTQGKAVCEGYAKAFKILCDRAGIPCVLVLGSAEGISHMWNYVCMEDGAWYAVDTTWDDTFFQTLDFFLVGRESVCLDTPFAESHLPNGLFSTGTQIPFSFAYPVLSEASYAPLSADPLAVQVTDTQISLAALAGYEYRCADGPWQQSPTFSSLRPGTTYTFTQRLAESPENPLGRLSRAVEITTQKSTPAQPMPPTFAYVSDTGVVLHAHADYLYRCNEGPWQSSPVFLGLSPDTAYRFTCRTAESDTALASEESAPMRITTGSPGTLCTALTFDPTTLTVRKIPTQTTAKALLAMIGGVGVRITRQEEPLPDTAYVGTGDTLQVQNTAYTAIVTGDLNGDGKVSITDLVQLRQSQLSGQPPLYFASADIDADGTVSATDYILLKGMIFADMSGE